MGVAFRFICSDLSARNDLAKSRLFVCFSANLYYHLPIEIKTGESLLGIGFNLSNLGTKISVRQKQYEQLFANQYAFCLSYLVPFDKFNRLAIIQN